MKHIGMKSRSLSLLLVLAILLTAFPASATLASNGASASVSEDFSDITVLHDGAAKSSVTIRKDGTETLTAFTADNVPDTRTWQIRIPDTDSWVNIYGQSGETLAVTYALVGSMLDGNDCAYIRAAVTSDEKAYTSDPVEIKVSHSVTEKLPEETPALMMRSSRAMVASDDTNLENVSIVINYIFDNGGLAFEPYGASVAKGSNFSSTVTSPTVAGYAPFIRVGTEYVDATEVVLNYTNITENVTINVIYEPTIVEYQVHHHFQDLYDDGYSLHPDRITYAKGLTNSTIPDGLALSEEELPGFTALAYEKLTVAADGSTVVEIRYNRNYYLVQFEMEGGYGTDPVYTRFGSLVGANDPIRHGYIFDGWEMVSYGGVAPTTEQASMYDINVGTITLPDANLVFRARWITQIVNYTMVFWKENINDNGFTYWGCLDGLSALSGTTVSGEDRIDEISGIDDERYFTYNAALTDKNVLVEGDGSTVVNVYYTRNRYTISFVAPGKCAIPAGHTHTDSCYTLLCTKGHIHTDECDPKLTCKLTEHSEHTSECIKCGITEHEHSSACCGKEEHTHIKSCFSNVGDKSTPWGAPTGVEDGYIYRYIRYYICIGGEWYRYNGRNVSSGDVVDPTCGKDNHTHGSSDCGCALTPHTHQDSCYSDELHVHDAEDCYSYSCGSDHHVHEEGCSILNCGIPTGHNHTNTCNSTTSNSTVKLVYRKYQESLESIWPITDSNGVTYDSGERWSPSGSDTYSAVLVFISSMPGESFTLTLDESNYDTYTMNYYLEVLSGDEYDVVRNGKYYKLYTTIKANYNYITYAEDFFDIHGFYRIESNPAFKNNQIDISGGGTVNFYYGRRTNYLEFNNNGIIISDKTQYDIPYQQSLKQYNFVPDYPANLEPGAYEFGGWYTSYNCFDGTEVDWDTVTMDADAEMFYAKWSYVTHKVDVYLDDSLTTKIGDTQYVSHNNFASVPVDTVTNGNYVFQGWFYKDTDNGETVEKAFVFTGIPVLQDMKIYAKWSSHVSVKYTINYVLKNTGEVIADPTVGTAIAGHNKTFYAKAGNDLNAGFREGYYPLTSSHTVTMSAESDHTYTFEYVYVESMPYLVRYVDQNGNDLIAPKKVLDNNLSVVTEMFVRINGYMPDAYQKRLVLSASGSDTDGDGISDLNVITFTYDADSVHAYYRVVHYIENISEDGYREYRSEETVGNIGEAYTLNSISITGFSLNKQKTRVNSAVKPISGTTVTETLTSEGLLVEFYYDRVDVTYTVKYLETGTNKVLYPEKTGEGIFGEQIVEYAPGLTHLGYSLVSDSVKDIHLSANEGSNVIEFYYQETIYSLKYRIVGSVDGASLSISSENILAVSGKPSGSVATVKSGYHLVGWYYDEACTRPVPAAWVDTASGKITPKSDGVWLASHTYFARIDPDFTSLKISTLGCSDVDENQVFIFNVKGTSENCSNVSLNVTVVGNSSVNIDHLPVGTYTVTELTDWSYRYTPDGSSRSIQLSIDDAKNVLTFSHIRSKTKWLDGNAVAENDFD